ncbi:MAG: TlpA family protein disulfide reductase [Solirubrobacteraceae bacterium]
MSAPPPPPRPAAAPKYTWYVGILVVIILAYILINTLRTEGPGSQGPRVGSRLPPFAAPALASRLDGDANIATPGNISDQAGRVPACELRGADIVNLCQLGHSAPLVLGFFFTRGSECSGSFDVMQRLQARNPGVAFAGVVVKGDRDEARRIAGEHGWRFPIAYDADGGIANLYGIAGCPEVVLAYPGGVVRETVAGRDRAERELGERVAALVAGSRRRGWTP